MKLMFIQIYLLLMQVKYDTQSTLEDYYILLYSQYSETIWDNFWANLTWKPPRIGKYKGAIPNWMIFD